MCWQPIYIFARCGHVREPNWTEGMQICIDYGRDALYTGSNTDYCTKGPTRQRLRLVEFIGDEFDLEYRKGREHHDLSQQMNMLRAGRAYCDRCKKGKWRPMSLFESEFMIAENHLNSWQEYVMTDEWAKKRAKWEEIVFDDRIAELKKNKEEWRVMMKARGASKDQIASKMDSLEMDILDWYKCHGRMEDYDVSMASTSDEEQPIKVHPLRRMSGKKTVISFRKRSRCS